MAFYGKLKSLTTDTSCVFHVGIRMISLKKLRIRVKQRKDFETELKDLRLSDFRKGLFPPIIICTQNF